MCDPIQNRYEFVILFDVENGNPNGDPDAGNMPRVDPETGLGLVTDVCLKRKIRNYVETVKEDAQGFRIYVKDGIPLNRSDLESFTALGVTEKNVKEKKKSDPEIDKKLRDWMCANFYDIRTFGAVMTTFTKNALNCGQVRGPVQFSFAHSVEPVVPQEVTITRVAITTEADAERKGTEMGRKYIIPYGLYRCEGFVSANLARKTTGFSDSDLELLWEAIINMFEHDHSAARGKMAVAASVGGFLLLYGHTHAGHSIGQTVGGYFDIPHGMACAYAEPWVLEFNAPACPELTRRVGQAFGAAFTGKETPEEIGAKTRDAFIDFRDNRCGLPSIKTFPYDESLLDEVAEVCAKEFFQQFNPRKMAKADCLEILRKMYA